MATVVASPPPSPPLPESPGSLSSASSQSDSSSHDPPKPASPPQVVYTSLEDFGAKGKFPAIKTTSTASPAGSSSSTRTGRRAHGHRPSQSMSRLTSYPSTSAGHGSSGGVSDSPSQRRRPQRMSTTSVLPSPQAVSDPSITRPLPRSRTLSFSSAQQAFLPSAPRLSSSTSSASVLFPFPSTVEEGVVSTGVPLDRTPSTASTSSMPARRPRPTRTSLTTRSAHTLRVPGPSAGRPGRVDVPTEYLEAKVVILGSQGVGKTSLINRSTYGRFNHSRTSTVGATFHTKKLTIEDTKVHLQLWDSGGQERFRSMAPLYYRGALAAILVYDVTDETSLEDIKYWIGELRKNMSSELVILVVGTKADLSDSYPTIPLADAQRSVALWLHELDHPPEEDSPTPSTLHRPAPPPAPPPQPKTTLTRSRTYSSPHGSTSRLTPFPQISTTVTPPPPDAPAPGSSSGFSTDSRSSRVRKLSNKPTQSSRPATPRGLTSSLTMPDLTGYTLASLNLATPHPHAHGSSAAHDSLVSAGMARSSSGGAASSSSTASSAGHSHGSHGMVHSPTTPSLSLGAASRQLGLMSFSGLATVTGAGRRLSHDERLRREWEEHERGKREREEREEERVRRIVEECEVEVVEVSAKDGFGIEEIFLAIAAQLITRKAEIEAARVLRSRDSIILRDEGAIDTTQAGWCAC
ncbi:hypothetical protein JCM8097_004092 [Rhodosporidiobolus ruineniae]